MLYSELVPERIFRFYGVRFQIEFAFRDAMQHLGLNDSQARSQAKLHFRFNICLHRPVLSPPAGPALGAAPPRPRADTPPNPRPVAATSRRNAVAARTSSRSEAGHIPDRLGNTMQASKCAQTIEL